MIAELIEALRQKNPAAFKAIVEEWQHIVYNTILSIVQSREDAQELAQDVFVVVYQEGGNFKGESKFSTWLYRIAVNKSLEHLRRQKRKKRFVFVQSLLGNSNEVKQDPPEFVHPGTLLQNKEAAIILAKAVRQLPEKQRIAFTLHKLEGMSQNEIAAVLQISEESVSSLIYRAKNNLKQLLQLYFEK